MFASLTNSIIGIMSDLKQRSSTALLIGIPMIFLVLYSDMTRIIFLSLVLIFCAIEFLTLQYKSAANKFTFIVPSLLVSGITLVSSLLDFGIAQYFLYVGVSFNIMLILDLFFFKKNLLSKIPWMTGVLLTTIPIAALMFLKGRPEFRVLVIGILFLIWISDIGAYAVGRSIGKNKLMPTVSPGKSWEGFIGAGVLCIAASFVFFKFLGVLSLQQWIVCAAIIWFFGSIGDLVESKMKRHIGVKDSGTILPGHGGFLDRFDGFYFCIPFVLLFIHFR